jgi:hypothetical protein
MQQEQPKWSLTLLAAFFLTGYAHVRGSSKECKCATSLTFTFTAFCLRWSACGCRIPCDDWSRHFRCRTCFDNLKQSTSNWRVMFVNVSDYAQLHSWWSCSNMYTVINSTHCNEVSCTTSPPRTHFFFFFAASHTPPYFVVSASFLPSSRCSKRRQQCYEKGVPLSLLLIQTYTSVPPPSHLTYPCMRDNDMSMFRWVA